MVHSTTTPKATCQLRGHHNKPTILSGLYSRDPALMGGVLEQARVYGWRLVDVELTQETIPPNCNPVGACIRLPIDHPSLKWATKLNCPIVRLGRFPHPLDCRVPAILADYAAAGRLAAEHYAERNFEQLGFVRRQSELEGALVWDAFRQRAEELGCRAHLLQLSPVRTDAESHSRYRRRSQEVAQWLSPLPKPIGLLAGDSTLAARLVAMCLSAELEVPEQVAVLSLGNSVIRCETAPVELSAVDLNSYAQGRQAVRLLHQVVSGHSAPHDPLFVSPSGVVERRSTSVLAVSDPVVAKALRYIWDHLDLQVSIDHIALQVGVSRRSLERAFHKCLGRTINAERLRKRLERCAELLRNTNWTTKRVAHSAGFPSPSYMHRVFLREYGLTPRQFRKKS